MIAARVIGRILAFNEQHFSEQELKEWGTILGDAPFAIDPKLRSLITFVAPHVAEACRELELRLWFPLRGNDLDRLVAKEWREHQEFHLNSSPTPDEQESLNQHSELGHVNYLLVRMEVIWALLAIQRRIMVRDRYYLERQKTAHDTNYRLIGQSYHLYIGKQIFGANFKNREDVDTFLTMMYGHERSEAGTQYPRTTNVTYRDVRRSDAPKVDRLMLDASKLQRHIALHMHYSASFCQSAVYGADNGPGSTMERLLLSTHTENRPLTPDEKGIIQAYLDTFLKPWNAASLSEVFFELLDDISVEQALIADLDADMLLSPRRHLNQVLHDGLMRVVSPLISLASLYAERMAQTVMVNNMMLTWEVVWRARYHQVAAIAPELAAPWLGRLRESLGDDTWDSTWALLHAHWQTTGREPLLSELAERICDKFMNLIELPQFLQGAGAEPEYSSTIKAALRRSIRAFLEQKLQSNGGE